MSDFRTSFKIVSGFETEPDAHNTLINTIEGASKARRVLSPRAPGSTLIQGFSGGHGRRHVDRIVSLAREGKGMIAAISDDINKGGIVTASMPEGLTDTTGNLRHYGIFVDCFFVGQSRKERLVEGYKMGADMAKLMVGKTIEIPRVSAITGRSLKPDTTHIPEDSPIFAIEPSTEFEATERGRLRRFLGGQEDIEAIRVIRAEANDAIVEAGFNFVEEADLTRESYPRVHQPGRYALYQFPA